MRSSSSNSYEGYSLRIDGRVTMKDRYPKMGDSVRKIDALTNRSFVCHVDSRGVRLVCGGLSKYSEQWLSDYILHKDFHLWEYA